MTMKFIFELQRTAKGSGQDRYIAKWTDEDGDDEGPQEWIAYFPRVYTRHGDLQIQEIQLTIDVSGKELKSKHALQFNLVQAAKSKGGDKYACEDMDETEGPFILYIPQSISRDSGEAVSSMRVGCEPLLDLD